MDGAAVDDAALGSYWEPGATQFYCQANTGNVANEPFNTSSPTFCRSQPSIAVAYTLRKSSV